MIYRSIAVVVVVSAIWGLPPSLSAGGELAHHGVSTLSKADEASRVDALHLFTAEGLPAPRASVSFHQDAEACGGMMGRTSLSADPPQVVVCASHPKPEVEIAWKARTLLHELAHVWIGQNSSQEDAFTAAMGLPTWSNRDYPWHERASEHAAEILMWGLQDGAYDIDARLRGPECGELADAYEMLTGIVVVCPTASETDAVKGRDS